MEKKNFAKPFTTSRLSCISFSWRSSPLMLCEVTPSAILEIVSPRRSSKTRIDWAQVNELEDHGIALCEFAEFLSQQSST